MAAVIDWNLPLELDDGRPAFLKRVARWGGHQVSIPGTPYRAGHEGHDYGSFTEAEQEANGGGWYYSNNGVFDGGNQHHYCVLRNVQGPETIEDWRL